MKWEAAVVFTIALAFPLHATAEEQNLVTLKKEITEAHNVERAFADGLQHCAALDGKSFYNDMQKRVVLLTELETSVNNLIKDRVFNPQKKHPWTASDAEERMKLAQLQAERDQRNCKLVARLPEMNKKLDEMETKR
jgi:hypothetical protein